MTISYLTLVIFLILNLGCDKKSSNLKTENSLDKPKEGSENFARLGTITFDYLEPNNTWRCYRMFLPGNIVTMWTFSADSCFSNQSKVNEDAVADEESLELGFDIGRHIPKEMLDFKNKSTRTVCTNCVASDLIYFSYTNWGWSLEVPDPINREYYIDYTQPN